ncbi:MAG TPA: hypothetical protein VMV40_09990 [Acidiferrobacter sp.]|nr:hypothetical protein [Acidiferrobacter sp.]
MSESETESDRFVVRIEAIRGLLPHTGTMCLLAGVRRFDQATIDCLATNHRDPDHPLRAHDRLGAVCGVEYAAQATAIHGALLAPAPAGPPRAGALVGLRQVRFEADRLDDVQEDLLVACHCLARDEGGAMYDFRVLATDRVLLSGRVTVTFAPSSIRFTPPEGL